MELTKAKPIAQRIEQQLAPWCDDIEIAGSIRRQKREVHDIEIVALPSVERSEGLFTDDFSKAVYRLGRIEKGKPQGKYCKIALDEGIMLDLFIASDWNWGNILTIRTGPHEFNTKVLIPRLRARGYVLKDGYVWRTDATVRPDQKLVVNTERYLFKLMELEYLTGPARDRYCREVVG